MKATWTRRELIETGLKGSLVLIAGASTTLAGCGNRAAHSSLWRLRGAQRRTLAAVLEEIIPGADGMPSANSAASLDYVETLGLHWPPVREAVERSLSALGRFVRRETRRELANLDSPQRQQVLASFQRVDEASFSLLRTITYEAYYTNPDVWHLLGYQPHPTMLAGPALPAFDPERLTRMRALKPIYRKVE